MGVLSKIPFKLGSSTAAAVYVPPSAGGTTDPTGSYDFLIGDVPFIAANDPQFPYRRQTVPVRKQQIDTSAEPGEQTILDWWLRAQSSFHAGAGRKFEEQQNQADETWNYQFHESQGVDVWTQGEVSLLKSCGQVASTTGLAGIVGTTDASGNDYLLGWSGTTLTVYTLDTSDDTVTSSTVSWGGATTIKDVVTDGSNYYVCATGGIYKGALPSGAGTLVWNSGSDIKAAWVKQRLIVGIGASLYELPIPNTSGGTTLPTANYTHPNSDWVWTDITEGPDAIYASGFAGGNSAIYKILLDTSVDPPVLTPGIVAMTLPYGEVVHSLTGYMGGYLVVGTNKGVRVCEISGDGAGSVTLLAPSITLPDGADPCYGSIGDDRFVYVAYGDAMPDGDSGLARIDLSMLTAGAKFAWATDLQAHVTGPVLSVAHWGARKAFLVSGSGIFFEHGSALESTGYLKTGKIRFHTLERKLFKRVRMFCAPLQGSLQTIVYDSDDTANTLAVQDSAGEVDLDEQLLALPAQEYVSLKFILTPDAATDTNSPTFRGYQLKALPAVGPQRREIIPLQCWDRELDRNGNELGTDGWAWSRIQRVEALEEAADAIVVQHLAPDSEGEASRLVIIEDVTFTQTDKPNRDNAWGGILQVTVKSLT